MLKTPRIVVYAFQGVSIPFNQVPADITPLHYLSLLVVDSISSLSSHSWLIHYLEGSRPPVIICIWWRLLTAELWYRSHRKWLSVRHFLLSNPAGWGRGRRIICHPHTQVILLLLLQVVDRVTWRFLPTWPMGFRDGDAIRMLDQPGISNILIS